MVLKKKKKVVVVGGGTGTFTVLSGLKKYPLDLSAVVTMADDGGSSGILRDELGVLPPGDIRQCLVALSESDRLMRDLMNYRFTSGKLNGHSFGNLLLSALEKLTGSFDKAVFKASEILRINGEVIPSTLNKVNLVAHLNNRLIVGENKIYKANLKTLKKITLEPKARANPKAIIALLKADLIIIGPGDFYSSLVPNLLVLGIPEAIKKSRAKIVLISNLMTKTGHTENFGVEDFTKKIEYYLGGEVDYVIYNNSTPDKKLLDKYSRHGEFMVKVENSLPKSKFIGNDLLSKRFPEVRKGDPIQRTLIRHDQNKLARVLLKLISK